MSPTNTRPIGARRRRRSPWQAALAVGITATMLAACGGGDDEPTTEGSGGGEGSGEVQDVTFLNILPLESLTFTPELVAASCGQFEENGLNVTFETTQGSAQAIQTVLAGGALITRVGDMETMVAIGERDAPLVNVGQINKTGTIRFVSAESDPLETAADIEGRLMGTPSEGGTSELIIKVAASSAGIDPDDVQTQVVGLAPGVFDLVSSGRIGGYVVSLDTSVALQKQQPDAVIYSPSDDVESGGQVYITSQEQADDPEKQEQLTNYLAAIKEAVQFVAEDEANDFAETIECLSEYAIPTLEDPEVGKAALTQYVESWTAAGEEEIARTVPDQWATVYEEMSGARFVPEGLDPEEWFTNDFAPGLVTSRPPADTGPASPTHVRATPSGGPEAEAGSPAGQEDRMTMAPPQQHLGTRPGAPHVQPGPPGEAQLEVIEVDKTYQARRGEVHALSNVNLSIAHGEFISLVGRSGCGKTTLLRILAGLLPPSSGTVTADGESIWRGGKRNDKAFEHFGLVFQDANLFPWFTVADNVSLPLKLRGVGRKARRARAAELCELVGLPGFENAYPRELSGGMRQRAAIARALSYDPTILLMDEPFGALDALTRDKMNLELQSIHAQAGATVVFVTHSINEAVFLADRVVLLTPRPGRIRSITPVPLARPRSLETETSAEFQTIVRELRHELDEE